MMPSTKGTIRALSATAATAMMPPMTSLTLLMCWPQIADDDPLAPAFSIADASAGEGEGTVAL